MTREREEYGNNWQAYVDNELDEIGDAISEEWPEVSAEAYTEYLKRVVGYTQPEAVEGV
jgi:hypothetical protein